MQVAQWVFGSQNHESTFVADQAGFEFLPCVLSFRTSN